MGELRFDGVGVPFAAFIQERAGGGAEAVAGHVILAITKPAQRRVDGVFRHGAVGSADAGKEQSSMAGYRVKVFQDRHSLRRERNPMRPSHFHATCRN